MLIDGKLSIYYPYIMENKPKFKPNPELRLMDQVRQVLTQMKGTHLLMAKVMYGGGLRFMECLRLRVMDLDFAKSQVHVRGKGGKDRLTALPPSIYDDLKAHLLCVKRISRP